MAIDQYIKEIVASTKKRRVEGKKRLQKLVFLLEEAGFPSGAKFFLKDYGPFSRDVESASDFMSFFGELVERPVEIGYSNYLATAYELPVDHDEEVSPKDDFVKTVRILDAYRTVDLEIASTIRFFQREGYSFERALRETKEIKPSKSTDKVIAHAKEILSRIPVSNVTAAHS